MTNKEIEELITNKKMQIKKLTKEIEELKKQHSILSERYEIAIIVKGNDGSNKNKVYKNHKKKFSDRQKAKTYGCHLRRKIHKGEIKINGEYSHIAMFDKIAPKYPVVWETF